ncbi:hypothetical protein OROHE_025056 [Orobanche hederae]
MNPSLLPPPPPPPPPRWPASVAFPPVHHPNLPPPPPLSSLSDALSDLSQLLQLSITALRSLPAPIATAAAAPTLLHCPFNPNHRLPSSSLFSHYLNCPFPLSLPHTFQYPLTLQSSSTTTVSLPTTTSDLSVSLENYAVYNASFFYENCPGPVTPSNRPPSLLNLPRALHIECVDFYEEPSAKETTDYPMDITEFLPSEIWSIGSETEAWGGDLPAQYSSRILRAILRLRDCDLSHLQEWIVASSPKYGVIIDFAMRDHVILLVRLCLKAIVREAFVLRGIMFEYGKFTNQSFECPVLVKVMAWLASQFSVLYGEVSGKVFAVDVLRACILDSALRASFFPLEQIDTELRESGKVDEGEQEPVQSISSTGEPQMSEEDDIKGETVGNCIIFISQVAAAVVALHERSLIEEKIKALRNSQPVSAYQRNMEHTYISKIADEERLKRPDYRPIIDHDGFLWQKSRNKGTNKVKTREELLAEERDYKRRRMSYRGKKSKRNTTEVMKDIIEEYMEEIKEAGGIGDISENYDIPEETRGRSLDYRKEQHSCHNSEDFDDDIQRLRLDSSRDHGHQDPNRSADRIRHDRDGKSHQRWSVSRERKYHKRYRDERERNSNHERERDKHERTSRERERRDDKREHGDRGRTKTVSARQERDVDNGGHGDIRERKTNRRNSSSRHREVHEFDDRYDPAESRDSYEEKF